MTIKSTFISIFFCFGLSFFASAQTTPDVSLKLIKGLKDYANLTQEKVYLSFDRPYYFQGEIMQFHAFAVDAVSHGVDSISGVLYVELYDAATNKLTDKRHLKIAKSCANGSFETAKIPAGEYLIHAYTRWMQNEPTEFHFYKKISILNAQRGPSVLETKSTKFKLQFFPEGGSLLAETPSYVGFKAVDENGKGVSIKGVVFSEKGDSIVAFEDDKLGMGRFLIKPQKDTKYTAKITADGKTINFTLPDAPTNGITLTLDNAKEDAPIRIFTYVNLPAEQMPSAFHLLAHVRGKLVFASKVNVTDKAMKTFRTAIPRDKLADVEGIVAFTIFDDKGLPLCERLFFNHNPQKRLDIAVKTPKMTYNKREEIKIEIETKDITGGGSAAQLSFVTAASTLAPPQYSEHLLSYLLLHSDLKGAIEQPAFYFQDTTKKTKRALDNLMLTQGWSRFSWQTIEQEKPDSILFLPQYCVPVSGFVTIKGQAVKNSSILVSVNSLLESSRFGWLKTDEKGYFALENISFTDSAKVIVKLANTKKDYDVNFLKPENTPVTPFAGASTIFKADKPTENMEQYLAAAQNELNSLASMNDKDILLKEVEIKATKKQPKPDARSMTYHADKSLDLKDGESFVGNLLDYLRFQNYDYRETENGEVFFLPLTRSYGSNSTPMLLVDGHPQEDASMLRFISVNEVEKIDISRTGTGMGSFNSDVRYEGIINILTKSGNPSYVYKPTINARDEKAFTAMVMGFAVQKQGYVPDYAEPKPQHDLPDRRNVLHWSPNLSTDDKGKTTVRFFASDNVGMQRIFVEGVDAKGRIGVKEVLFEVK
jgi:hypothetical protein